MARITIDEQGKVVPPGAAYVETMLPWPPEHLSAGPRNLPSNSPAATVQYQCRRCAEVSGRPLAELPYTTARVTAATRR
jgi:hypothetical protein